MLGVVQNLLRYLGVVNNQQRGKAFEIKCYEIAREIAPELVIKHVKRPNIYVSYYDIEFVDFGIKADCKFTFNDFTYLEKLTLYKNVKTKYGSKSIVIIGERRAKARLSYENDVKVLILSKFGLAEINYRSWLLYLKGRKNAQESKP